MPEIEFTPGRAQVNVAVTMLLGGLWHGASWTFLLWGAWHGAFLALERRLGKVSPYGRLPHALQVAVTFAITTLGFVLFRCYTVGELSQMATGLFGGNGAGAVPDFGSQQPIVYGALAVGLLIAFLVPRSELLVRRCHPAVMLAVLAAFAAAVGQLLSVEHVPFIYFQF